MAAGFDPVEGHVHALGGAVAGVGVVVCGDLGPPGGEQLVAGIADPEPDQHPALRGILLLLADVVNSAAHPLAHDCWGNTNTAAD